MHFFRNLKIRHQLLILFWVFVIGFIGIGVIYRQVSQIENSTLALFQQVNAFLHLENQLSIDLVSLRAASQRFLDEKDLSYADEFETLIDQAYERLDQLQGVALDEQARRLVDEIRKQLRIYEDGFDALLDLQVEMGLDETKGLQGEMKVAIHSIEQQLQTIEAPKLLISLLQMRRYEKNLLLQGRESYLAPMKEEEQRFGELLQSTALPTEQKQAINHALAIYQRAFQAIVNGLESRKIQIRVLQKTWHSLNQLLGSILPQKDDAINARIQSIESVRNRLTAIFVGTLILVGLIVTALLLALTLRLRRSLARLQDTVQRVAEGDLEARTRLETQDELGTLGRAFDRLLQERVANLAAAEKENERLNESIIALMMAVSKLSQKDLTVRAPVAEDVTGSVSDAVNLMASETAKVLSQIRDLSYQVEQAATQVRAQAERVSEVAAGERTLVQENTERLQQTNRSMSEMAADAQHANRIADQTIGQTRVAREAVSTTVQGIEQIREIIHETEKRIKRLGERSQEITGAVNLINTIAERTHILALNASMHAASAGEAGRGFAVVAEEVQRLAGNSREATGDISRMVNAIRVETADTVDTMNRLITQVAEGTRLAQGAGQQMRETESITAELVAAVGEIAEAAERQAENALELARRSERIRETTEETRQALKEQSEQTERLVTYSDTLLRSVRVFKLPEKIGS